MKNHPISKNIFSNTLFQQEVLDTLPQGVLITDPSPPFEPKFINQTLLHTLDKLTFSSIQDDWSHIKKKLGGTSYWNEVALFSKRTKVEQLDIAILLPVQYAQPIPLRATVSKIRKEIHYFLIHTFQDATETSKVEHSLDVYKHLLKDVYKATKLGNWEYNLRNNHFYWTKEVFTMLGIPFINHRPSLKLFYDHIHHDDLEEVVNEIENCVFRRKAFNLSFRIVNNKDQVFRVTSRGHIEYDLQMKESKLVGTIQDITEVESLKIQLKEVEEKYNYIKHIARIGTCEWDLGTDKISFSEDFAKIVNLPYHQDKKIKLRDFINLVHPMDKNLVSEALEGFKIGHKFKPLYFTIITPQKQIKHVFTKFNAIESRNKQPKIISIIIHDISERKEIQNELKYYEHLHQNVNDAIISTNHLLEIKSWNKAAEDIYNWKASEVIGRNIQDVLDHRKNKDFYDSLFTFSQWTEKVKHFNKKGQERVIQSSAKLFQISTDTSRGIVMVNRDITDVVEVEQRVHASKHMLELIFENIPGWIFWTNKNLDVVGCNNSFSKIINKEIDETNPTPLREILLFKDSFDALYANLSSVFKNHEPTPRIILPLYLKNKIEYWIEISHVPLNDYNGTIMGVLSTVEDITERKLIEEELKEKQANLIAIIENTDDFICYLDTDLELKAFNTAFDSIHIELFKNEPVIGTKYLDTLPYEMRSQLEEVFTYVLTNKKLRTEREILIDGDYKWFEFSCNPVINDNSITGICFIFRDITRRKINEKLILESKLQQEKVRSLGLIQGQEEERRRVSMELHDGVGQILTALQMQTNYLQSKNDNGSLDSLNDNLSKIGQLVSDAKQEIRRISFNLMPSMLNDFGLADSIEHLCSTMFDGSQIHVNLHLEIEGKRFDTKIEVSIFRVAQEILNNILKHSKANAVTVRLSADNSNLYFSINDDGVGFDLSKRNKNRQMGNGLRNIAQRINLLNGVLNMKSQPGQGSNFSVMVPFNQEPE